MEKIKITYAGRYDNGGKVLSNLYFDEEGRRFVFSSKLAGVSIGFKVECNDEGGGTYSGFKPIEEKAEQSFIDEHIARDKAVFELFRTKQLTKKILPNEYDKIMKRLKDLTLGLSRAEKRL